MPITPGLIQRIEDLKAGHEIVYGYLGIKAVTATARERKDAGIETEIGARIETIDDSSPASNAGLLVGDIVTRFNNSTVTDGDHLVRMVGDAPAKQTVSAEIIRQGKKQTVSIPLGRRPMSVATVTRDNQRFHWRGLLLGPIPAHWSIATGRHAEPGVMVLAVEPTSPFATQGIKAGSVLTNLGGQPVQTIVALQKIVNDTPAEKCAAQFMPGSPQVVSIDGD
jgi:serine protease Do